MRTPIEVIRELLCARRHEIHDRVLPQLLEGRTIGAEMARMMVHELDATLAWLDRLDVAAAAAKEEVGAKP